MRSWGFHHVHVCLCLCACVCVRLSVCVFVLCAIFLCLCLCLCLSLYPSLEAVLKHAMLVAFVALLYYLHFGFAAR